MSTHPQSRRTPARSNSQSNQYADARKALQSIGNSKRHKNQVQSYALKFYGKSQEDDMFLFHKAAEEGNFAKLISLLASQKTEEDRHHLMNEALQRHSEAPEGTKAATTTTVPKKPIAVFLQNKINGKPPPAGKDWYDLTPLARAAINGRANVVEYLLRQGADPTLRGSPSEDEDYNALEAAKQGVKATQKEIDSVLSSGKDDVFQLQQQANCANSNNNGGDCQENYSALDLALTLVKKRDRCLLCVALLESVEQFWPRAQAYSSHYRKRSYTNKPRDMKKLRAALDAITLEGTGKSVSPKTAIQEALVNRLAAKLASKPLEADSLPRPPLRISKNRGRRHSGSFYIVTPPTSMVVTSESTPACTGLKNLQLGTKA